MRNSFFTVIVRVFLLFFIIQQNDVFAQNRDGMEDKVTNTISSEIQDSLAFELCQIFGSDQGLRTDLMTYNMKLDSINFHKIINFIKKYGYPTRKLLGKNIEYTCVYAAPVVVFLHNPQRIAYNKEYANLLLEEVKKGNLSQVNFNTFLDKYYLAKKENNFRIYMGSKLGKPCLEDRAKSDSVRAIYGLPPLKEEDFKDCNNKNDFNSNNRSQ